MLTRPFMQLFKVYTKESATTEVVRVYMLLLCITPVALLISSMSSDLSTAWSPFDSKVCRNYRDIQSDLASVVFALN